MNIVKTLLLVLGFLGGIHSAQASESAWFTILKPDGSPFQNTSLYVYNGDIKFRSFGNMYPYGEAAKEKSHFLSEVKTDEHGNFGIKVQNFKQRSFLIIAGSVYHAVQIEKSNGLAHTPSDDHIRYVEWEDNSTRVKANHIYNWRKQTVVTIPLFGDPLPEKPAERIILKTYYMPRLAPYISWLEQEKIDALFRPLETLTYNYNLKDDAHRAMIGDHLTLRAYAATYLGKYGVVESVPFLIDALSDQSVHVGANYKNTGMATTRYRANLALKELVGEDFGFVWNASLDQQNIAINQWKEWLNERNIILDKAHIYLKAHMLENYKPYRSHLNGDKTEWSVALTETPPQIGAPVLLIDRQTYAIQILRGH
ncbi:MAG: hypothetical protein COA45_05480 [Zetaproteobacteria bacterium]|nr:MAG: hypothetical protein COA45_05480 [Zetaproteobacteria bacterium]